MCCIKAAFQNLSRTLDYVESSERLVGAQVVLHKHFVLSRIFRLSVFDGEERSGVADVEENSAIDTEEWGKKLKL